jgi:hypothetical protein
LVLSVNRRQGGNSIDFSPGMASSLSKAAYNMTRGVKSSAPTVQQLHENLWIARGALRFPQGIQVLYNHFASKHPAECLSHPYFIEKEYWPEQPSPQFQLTEEIQCLMLVIKGNDFSRDVSTHLDNTMSILRNPVRTNEFALFNPVEVSNSTLTEVRKVIGDGIVTKIVVPTKQTWQSVGEWALQFPHAEIFASGNVPYRFTKKGSKEANEALEQWKQETKWYEREKEHAEAKQKELEEERLRAEERAAGKKPRPNMVRPAAPIEAMRGGGGGDGSRYSFAPSQVRQQHAASLFGNTSIGPSPFTYMANPTDEQHRMSPEDAAKRKKDVDLNRLGRTDLFSNAAFADELDEGVRKRVVAANPHASTDELKTDSRAIIPPKKKKKKGEPEPRELSDEEKEAIRKESLAMIAKEPAPDDVADNVSILDPYTGLDLFGEGSSRLLHVSGDKNTNEFVLYHAPSKMLACTDLYHGGYSDLDPMNTWLCRIWFKFQRQGNYKSTTILPAYRRIVIEKFGKIREVQECVDDLTRAFPIKQIVPAHGTPPFIENAAEALREMYNLPPIDETAN